MLSPDPAWPAGTSAPRCRCVRKGVDSGKSSPYRMTEVAQMGLRKVWSVRKGVDSRKSSPYRMTEVTQRGLREVRSFRKGVDPGKSSPYRMTRVAHMDDGGGAGMM